MIVTGPKLREVTLDEEGVISGLEPDSAVIDTSTASCTATAEVAKAVRDAGGRFVDLPVLGTIGPAKRGELLASLVR